MKRIIAWLAIALSALLAFTLVQAAARSPKSASGAISGPSAASPRPATTPKHPTTFFLLMAEQANLTAAKQIGDWQARGRWVVEQLQATAERSQASIRYLLASKALSGHVSHWRSFWIVNAIAVQGDEQAARILARQPGVARILPEVKLEPPVARPVSAPSKVVPDSIEWNIRQINADDLWGLGITGQGLVVANVDTGVDYTHPALVRQYRGNLGHDASGPFDHDYNWFDPFWGTTEPQALPVTANSSTPHRHGTHVMGTEVGSEGANNQIGVAPGARWIAAYGCCPDNESLLAALQWMLAPTKLDGSDPNPDLRPHALQNSWGGPGGSLIFNQAMAALKAAGVFVSASAGNNGGSGCGSMGSPGDNPAVFSVGASTSSDTVAPLSSRGPHPFTGGTGPDLVAPGKGVRSSVPGGLYSYMDGTSMAGPHVAGAVALLWQANPALIGRVDYTAELLRQTAEPLYMPGEHCGGVDSGTERPNNSAGWGRLDVLRAAQVAGDGRSRLIVRVTDDQGTPLPGATVTLRRPEASLGQVALRGTTDADGTFEFLTAPGLVTTTASLFGYQTQTATVHVAVYLRYYFPLASGSQPVTPTRSARPTWHHAGAEERRLLSSAGTLTGQSARQRGLQVVGDQLQLTLTPLPQVTLHGFIHDVAAVDQGLTATVSLPGTPITPVTTSCSGVFTLTLPVGQHQLRVEAVGYWPRLVPISLTSSISASIALTPTWDYEVADSRHGDVTYQWMDARGGTRYNLGDDAWTQVNLPPGRSFTFYGQSYQQVYLSSNGFVTFGSPFARFHGVIPFEGQPNNAIYIYAEDLNPAANTQYGTGYDNGIYVLEDGDRWILQYNEVEHWSQGNPETFELILNLTSGEIIMQYQQVSWPDFTTVGVEDISGSRGVAYSYANSANLATGLAIRYRPVSGQPGHSCNR